MFTNKLGCRLTTIIGSLIASLGFILSYFATSIWYLYITIGLIVGFGFGLIYVPAIVSVGYYFEKRRSFAIGIAVCGTGVGTFILSPTNRTLSEHFGWNGALLIKGAFVLNGIVCGLVMRPLPIEPSEIRRKQLEQKSGLKSRG
jgi:MFS family permease